MPHKVHSVTLYVSSFIFKGCSHTPIDRDTESKKKKKPITGNLRSNSGVLFLFF